MHRWSWYILLLIIFSIHSWTPFLICFPYSVDYEFAEVLDCIYLFFSKINALRLKCKKFFSVTNPKYVNLNYIKREDNIIIYKLEGLAKILNIPRIDSQVLEFSSKYCIFSYSHLSAYNLKIVLHNEETEDRFKTG